MKSKVEKIKYLTDIKKETDIHIILEELLPEMGFSDVKVTHEKGNKPEFGKDLVCSLVDSIEGKKDWYAFVVKKGKVSGSSGAVRKIEDQVFECFKDPYKSLEIINTEESNSERKDLIFFQNFSNYGLMQIFGGWFKHNNWSITLKEPMAKLFDENFELLDADSFNKEEIFKLEFQLYLVSSILASDSFVDFERFKKLIDSSKLTDIDVLATLDTHYKSLVKHLPKSYRKNELLRSIGKKLSKRILSTPNFTEEVNKPLKQKRID